MAALHKLAYRLGARVCIYISIEAMHPPPAELRVCKCLTPPPRGTCANSSTPPPSCCSFVLKSLSHLLPRQAFLFSALSQGYLRTPTQVSSASGSPLPGPHA